MNTTPLPAGPFFCADDGGYLPGLTNLIVLALAIRQRHEIEEGLFKIKLKQKCFVALAERGLEVRSLEFGVGTDLPADGSDSGRVAINGPISWGPSDPAVTHSPVFNRPEQTGREAAPAENGALFSSNGKLEARVGCVSENPAAADPAHPEGKPESNIGELNSTGGGSRSHSIKVFPLGPVSTKGTDGASRQQCPTGFGVYPKGRW